MLRFLSTHPTKVAVCKKHQKNAYINVSKLNYFSTSINKNIAKAELGHPSVVHLLVL